MAWLFRLFSKQCNTAMHIVDIEFADRYIQHACKKILANFMALNNKKTGQDTFISEF